MEPGDTLQHLPEYLPCIFLLIYRFMPNTKTYWRYIWPGAIVAAVLFESAKNLFLTYVDQFANFENVYGSLAPVIALLLWAYVSSFILILGAELSSEYGRLRRGVRRAPAPTGGVGSGVGWLRLNLWSGIICLGLFRLHFFLAYTRKRRRGQGTGILTDGVGPLVTAHLCRRSVGQWTNVFALLC